MENRVVLITGAAGGLGQGLCREFEAQGWNVAAAYHQAKPDWLSDRQWPLELDVTQADQAERVAARIQERWGRLDVLINNAGFAADHLFWQIDPADWDRVLDVNLKGAFHCARAVLPCMQHQQGGHIINISSRSGLAGQRGQANYAAAKGGLLGFTAALAREVGSFNIRVNAILPGVLPTPMTASLAPARLSELASDNLLGRLNSVAEVAGFIVFLAGMKNVSGQIFQLDSRLAPWT